MRLQTWLYEKENGIAILKRSSRKACNAADNSLLVELDRIIDMAANDPRVRVLVITGETVDGDISFGSEPNQLKFEQFLYLLNQVVNKLERLPKLIIAAVYGNTFNLFFELALACDIRIAAQNALIGKQNMELNVLPEGKGFKRLNRLLGSGRANYMALAGAVMDAPMALKFGLVSEVVPDEMLLEEAKRIALQVLFHSSGKKMMFQGV